MAPPSEPPPRIEDYGLIGDMHTCALVAKNGSIDFPCWPTFDSPSIFARILDTTKGSTGHWSIKPRLSPASYICKQNYRSSTNVLLTKFIHEEGVVDLTDFFAVSAPNVLPGDGEGPVLVRKVECLRGRMPIDIEIRPKSNYAGPMLDSPTVLGPSGRPKNGRFHQNLFFSPHKRDHRPGDLCPWLQVVCHHDPGSTSTDGMLPSWDRSAGLANTTIDLEEGQCIYIALRHETMRGFLKSEDRDSLPQLFDLEHQVSESRAKFIRLLMRMSGGLLAMFLAC